MKLKPLGSRIIIKPEPEYIGTQLVLPEQAKRNTNKGVILAVGPGVRDLMTGKMWPVSLAVGQRVMFGKLRVMPFKEGSEDLVMVDESDCLCLLEE